MIFLTSVFVSKNGPHLPGGVCITEKRCCNPEVKQRPLAGAGVGKEQGAVEATENILSAAPSQTQLRANSDTSRTLTHKSTFSSTLTLQGPLSHSKVRQLGLILKDHAEVRVVQLYGLMVAQHKIKTKAVYILAVCSLCCHALYK